MLNTYACMNSLYPTTSFPIIYLKHRYIIEKNRLFRNNTDMTITIFSFPLIISDFPFHFGDIESSIMKNISAQTGINR
jgi:hypothetical protein